MLKISNHEFEFKRFVANQNKNIFKEFENLISIGDYKPCLTQNVFQYLQTLNDLSRSFCLTRRPAEFWDVAKDLQDELGKANVARGLAQPKVYIAERRGQFIQYYLKFVRSDFDHQFSYRQLVSLSKECSMIRSNTLLFHENDRQNNNYIIERAVFKGPSEKSKAQSLRAYNIFQGELSTGAILKGLVDKESNEYSIQYLNISLTSMKDGNTDHYNTFILNGLQIEESEDNLFEVPHYSGYSNIKVRCVCFECRIYRRMYSEENEIYDEIDKLPVFSHQYGCCCKICEYESLSEDKSENGEAVILNSDTDTLKERVKENN